MQSTGVAILKLIIIFSCTLWTTNSFREHGCPTTVPETDLNVKLSQGVMDGNMDRKGNNICSTTIMAQTHTHTQTRSVFRLLKLLLDNDAKENFQIKQGPVSQISTPKGWKFNQIWVLLNNRINTILGSIS